MSARSANIATCTVVHSESFDDYPGDSLVTTTFVEERGRTTVTIVVQYQSKQVRDAVVASGMEHGAAESFDKLAEYLESAANTTGTVALLHNHHADSSRIGLASLGV